MNPEIEKSVQRLAEAHIQGAIERRGSLLGPKRWLVLEGDWGGQIYLTVPWHLVGKGANIISLLAQLDRLAWPSNEHDGVNVYLTDEMHGVSGGMGGGKLEDGLWLHPEFRGEPTSHLQGAVDELRGATCEQVRAMDWNKIARELLDLS